LDLAEGHPSGHAARVCYIALNLAQGAGVPAEDLRTVFYASLLHDAGASSASEACRTYGLAEEQLFVSRPAQSPQQLALELAPGHVTEVVQVLHDHPARGAQVAKALGFPASVQQAIGAHHERWDGHGYPLALKGEAIPSPARIVAAADVIEALISIENNPLTARRNLIAALAEHAGSAIEPALVGLARKLARSDAFWLGLNTDSLSQELAASCPDDADARSPRQLEMFATVFADLADGKGEHTTNHGSQTARVAQALTQALGFSPARSDMVRIAALVHDVGLLGVPARIMAKPDILSLVEMEAMRKHPSHSQFVLSALPGLDEIAQWVGAHHERPDGKGYPELLEERTIPIEARIIALADTYVALTSPRPYRQALSHEDACQVLRGGAGTQLDPMLVDLFVSLPAPEAAPASAPATPKSSRTARRSRRTR
jgi:HD-GYP domain-containing protein (c-di-GMP phosphodiesterase class II)